MATADSARDIAAKIDATPIEEMGSQPQDEPHMFCSLLRYFFLGGGTADLPFFFLFSRFFKNRFKKFEYSARVLLIKL